MSGPLKSGNITIEQNHPFIKFTDTVSGNSIQLEWDGVRIKWTGILQVTELDVFNGTSDGKLTYTAGN